MSNMKRNFKYILFINLIVFVESYAQTQPQDAFNEKDPKKRAEILKRSKKASLDKLNQEAQAAKQNDLSRAKKQVAANKEKDDAPDDAEDNASASTTTPNTSPSRSYKKEVQIEPSQIPAENAQIRLKDEDLPQEMHFPEKKSKPKN